MTTNALWTTGSWLMVGWFGTKLVMRGVIGLHVREVFGFKGKLESVATLNDWIMHQRPLLEKVYTVSLYSLISSTPSEDQLLLQSCCYYLFSAPVEPACKPPIMERIWPFTPCSWPATPRGSSFRRSDKCGSGSEVEMIEGH